MGNKKSLNDYNIRQKMVYSINKTLDFRGRISWSQEKHHFQMTFEIGLKTWGEIDSKVTRDILGMLNPMSNCMRL